MNLSCYLYLLDKIEAFESISLTWVCIELFGSKHQNFPVNFDLFDLRTIKQTSPSLLLLNNHITDCTGFNVGEACTNYGEIVEKVSIPNNQDMHSG